MKDASIFDGTAWQSLKGPPGPSAISADDGNTLELGSDGLHFTTAPPDSDAHIWCRDGDDIADKYEQARLLAPGGNALSATNRATLVVLPGVYDLGTYYDPDYGGDLPRLLSLEASFVDVVGLGAVRLPSGCVPAVVVPRGVGFSANDARISGISAGASPFSAGDRRGAIFDCCSGGDQSFRGEGSYVNCTGGDDSFSGTGVSAFANCKAGGYSFNGTGSFINCDGGDYCFGGETNADGTFINCTGGIGSFGGSGTASGTFTNCTGGYRAFGFPESEPTAVIAASARLVGCRVTSGGFTTPEAGAILRFCLDETYNEVNTP